MINLLAGDLPKQLEIFLTDYPDTNLVVIGYFAKGQGQFIRCKFVRNDYKDIGLIKAFADKHRIDIIVVQHLRKW